MDKSLVLAVAGSGKTSSLINKLNLNDRFLIITYTINNTRNLKQSIINKFDYFPDNIELFSYYKFLYQFCFRPFLGYQSKIQGIYWGVPPNYTGRLKLNDIKRYVTNDRRLYHNRIAKLLEQCNVIDSVSERLEKYYDHFLIDEVQDFAGHDFNLLKSLVQAKINFLLVGDFYQHTFDTSRDGSTNKNLHNNFEDYKKVFKNIKIKVDTQYLNKSYRCTPQVCEFISDKLGIEIESRKDDSSQVELIENPIEVDRIFHDKSIVKLFYRENYKYDCRSRNWGDCKGENHYYDVCVVLNNTSYKHFQNENLQDLKPVSKNKLYVACSRANNNLYFIPEKLLKQYKQ